MKKDSQSLTFEQSVELLPDEFHPNYILPGRNRLLKTPKGVIAFRQSPLLENGEWQTNYNEDSISLEIDFLLFAMGAEGVILLPRHILVGFKDMDYDGKWTDSGYTLRVRKDDSRYLHRENDGSSTDVTDYFIPTSNLNGSRSGAFAFIKKLFGR